MPKIKTRVSIGLPVYNGEQFLRQAIDSVLAQTYRDFKLIISDNGSTDGTWDICRDYAAHDSRIQLHRYQSNQGASRNFNRVFELGSGGPYFKWIAADDVIEPAFIERCVDALDDDPCTVLVYPKTFCIDQSGAIVNDYDTVMNHGPWSRNSSKRFRQVMEEFEWNGGASANIYAFAMMRTSALRKTKLLGKHLAADHNLATDMALLGRFCELPEHLMSLRAHSGSSSWFEGAGWSLEHTQTFFDPKVKGGLAISLSKRRVHLEHASNVLRARLPVQEKASLLLYCLKPPLRRFRRKVGRNVAAKLHFSQ